MKYPWHFYFMAIIYFIAGLIHFVKPAMYMRIMPNYLPAHKTLVYLSGLAEIILAIGLLFPATKNLAIYGIILMLAIFLLVHIYMITNPKAAAGFPMWSLYARLPLQFALMWWAWYYLKY